MGRKHVRWIFDLVLVIGVALTLWRLIDASPSRLGVFAEPTLIRPQTRLDLPGVEWTNAGRHIVLMLSPKCAVCQQSTTFYSRLARQVGLEADWRLIVVAAEPERDVRDWLEAKDILAHDIVRVERPSALGFSVTPTLLLVDRNGVVTDIMAQRLSEQEENGVFGVIDGRVPSGSLNNAVTDEISFDGLSRAAAGKEPVIIDIRDRPAYAREHRPGTINLPREELATRAPIEVSTSALIAVDCQGVSRSSCRSAAWQLKTLGFAHVVLLIS